YGAEGLRRVEDRVTPWLTFRIRPAWRRAHAKRGEEQRAPAPDVLVRDSDLEVAVEQDAERPRFGMERRVLLVREQLGKGVAFDHALVLARDLLPASRLRSLRAWHAFPQPSIVLGPAQPIRVAVLRAERRVQCVPFQPEGVPHSEPRQPLRQLARSLRLEMRECFVDDAPRDRVRVAVRSWVFRT